MMNDGTCQNSRSEGQLLPATRGQMLRERGVVYLAQQAPWVNRIID